jgi:hypothetical protein
MPNNRTRGLLPPDPRRLGEEPLADGEVTRVMRVRGPSGPVEAFGAMTAWERGRIVAEALTRPPESE